jgi:arylsulfatase A-like enzyme
MARWPGRIPAGAVISEPFWSPDLFTACTRLAGAYPPSGVVLDGKDPLAMLTKSAESPHESFYFKFRAHAALRKGAWKIVREKPDGAWQLFNLRKDLGEARDRARDLPERVAELAGTFADWEKSFESDS